MKPLSIAAAGTAALALVAAGCGSSSSPGGGQSQKPVDPNAAEVSPAGDIPDNQAFVPYSPPGGGYSVKVPEGWGRTASGGAVTFSDKLNSVRMESVSAQAAPTVATVKRDELPKLAASVPGFKAAKVTSVKRPAGNAVEITYLSSSKPDSVTGKVTTNAVERYEFFRGGKEVVLTLTGPKGADNVDPWKIVTDSVTWK